jgi:fucose 4-O-acetylase-like acetyltransferase
LVSGPLYNREGYSEIFFPPTGGYIVMSIGVVMLISFLSRVTNNIWLWKIIRPMGESSLLVYILHIFAISTIYLEISVGKLIIPE